MPDIYDQELDGIDTAESEYTQEAEVTPKQGEAEPKKAEEKAPKEPAKATEDKGIRLSQDEYTALKRMQQQEALRELESNFKKKHPDFDMAKITQKILDMDEKDPGVAQMYFNEIGIENIYLNHFKGKSVETDDEFDVSRGINGGVSQDELISKINSGEASYEDTLSLFAKLS